jgi:hypothetical protein
VFLTDSSNDLAEPLHYSLHQHLAPVFGTPNDVVLAGIEHVPIGLVGSLAHRNSIQHKVIYCQWALSPNLPSQLKRNAPYIPLAEAKSVTARFDKHKNIILPSCPLACSQAA